ncbi:MAG: NAD(P)/FAD-dependent oxidoreductase [Oscillospiraceae bacterium]|nr:NAD(P)/FAD-dependent oxidoreductase [Oscillospiraceae bacterium]
MSTILIIGAGASGMLAALTAAEDAENRVLLLERQARVGRKLLATGNGRCNLTNVHAELPHYHGETPDFAAHALRAFGIADTLAWFRAHGLLTVTEPSGRVYPLSNSANSVLDVLRFAIAERSNIDLLTGVTVTALRRTGGGFEADTDGGTLRADKVIVACGGMAGGKLGGVQDGYALLDALGHTRTALHPALVQLTTDPTYPRALKGVRADARLTLRTKRAVLAQREGEVQFTEKGVSGPAAFDLARAVATGGEGLTLVLDLLRDYTPQDVLALLEARCKAAPHLAAEDLLTGALHNRLGKTVIRYVNLKADTPLSALSRDALRQVVRACKGFSLPVRGTEGFAGAQVTAGGIRCAEFDPETLQSRLVPGLYACGEVLDIDGDCGGYNLQWAWSSGRLAGRTLP